MKRIERYPILGVDIDDISLNETIDNIEEILRTRKIGYIVTVNNEGILESHRNPAFFDALRNSTINTADSTGVILASHVLSTPLKKGRVTGVDLVKKIAQVSKKKNFKIFLLGGSLKNYKSTQIAAENLREKYNGQIVAYDRGPIIDKKGRVVNNYSLAYLQRKIQKSRANILLVAFNAPGQEIWIRKNIKKLWPIQVAIGVGGVFDYLSSTVPDAPVLLRKYGLEWLWRLFTQKARFQRVFRATVVFLSRLFYWFFRSRFLYRQGVVAVIVDRRKRILICRQAWKPFAWQFVQGGVEKNETLQDAVYREIYEEIGIKKFDLKFLQEAKKAYKYDFGIMGRNRYGYKGQSKTPLLLQYFGSYDKILLDKLVFQDQRWVSPEALRSFLPRKRSNEADLVFYTFQDVWKKQN